MDAKTKRDARQRRHRRVRKHVRGTATQPRLAVYRSNTGVYAQVIDDRRGHTMVAASSQDKQLEPPQDEGKVGVAKAVGQLVAQRARDAGIERVVFDRGGNAYHGRVAAVADGAREGGLNF